MVILWLRWIIAFFFLTAMNASWAACSADYRGLATINEIHKASQGNNAERFIEIKTLASDIEASDYAGWTVSACTSAGCTGSIQVSSMDDSNVPWIVADATLITNGEHINFSAMDVILRDASGSTIDYLSVGDFVAQRDSSCTPQYDWQADGSNTKDLKREPDGTGAWSAAPGNSAGNSDGDTNDSGVVGPDIQVNSATVFQGTPADFTLSLSEAYQSDIEVTYNTQNDTAVAGTDYTASSGTVVIPAGQTSTTIAVPVLRSGSRITKRFFLQIASPSAGRLVSQTGIGIILPVATGYWQLDRGGWNGSASEVLDASGSGLHGRAVNGVGASAVSPARQGNPGTCGYALFDGTSQFVEVPDDPLLDLDTELTISAWINPKSFPSSGLKSIVSKDENYEFHIDNNGEIYWWWTIESGARRSFATSGAGLSLNTWHHVAVTYKSGRQRIYVDGVERGAAAFEGRLWVNNDPFQIGQDQGFSGRYFDGWIDEVTVFAAAFPATGVTMLYQKTHACPVPTLHALTISAPSSASVCAPSQVTVTAYDNNGNVFTDYTGTVSLTTDANHGNWAINSGIGLLSPDPDSDDNGSASYQFDAADAGQVVLDLRNSHADRLTIAARDTAAGVSATSDWVTFSANSLFVSTSDSLGYDVIGGRSHGFQVELLRQDPSTGRCGVATEYDGTFPLKAWLTRDAQDPGGLAPGMMGATSLSAVPDTAPGSDNIELVFTAGVAQFSWQTADVGKYALNLRDDSSGFVRASDGSQLSIGSSQERAPWIARPFAIAVEALGNPAASSATGPAYVEAGGDFTLRVTGVLYQSADDQDGNGIADSGAVTSDNAPAPAFGSEGESVKLGEVLVLPDSGANPPPLTGGRDPVDVFVDGEATDTYQFNEVGIISLNAHIDDDDYLGAGATTTAKIAGESGPIGRFYPARFTVAPSTSGSFRPTCTTGVPNFTYTGEDFFYSVGPEFIIRPESLGGDLLANYVGDFRHLSFDEITLRYPSVDAGSGVAISASPAGAWLSENGDGSMTLTLLDDSFSYLKDADSRVAPFVSDLPIAVDGILEALDSVSGAGLPVATTPTGVEIRYGRLSLENAYGPETGPLIMPMQAEYFNGARYVVNDAESCWSYDTGADATLTPTGLTSVDGAAGTLTGGLPQAEKELKLSAPGTGNTGEVLVEYTVPAWLQDDVDGDGALDNPSGIATFGVYRGHDRIIYWQER